MGRRKHWIVDTSPCATEISFCNDETTNPVQLKPVQFILGVNCQRKAYHWLLETWMLQVCQLDYGDICSDVSIIDAISEGIQSKKAFEFPILVSGKGSSHTDVWALGRLEWLAIKLRMPTQLVEESNRSEAMQNFWKSLEFVLKSNRWYRQLDIMWWYWYEYLELDAPICQSPTVVYIHVWPRIEAHAVTECFTTTEAENTASMSPVQIYPDSSPVCQIYPSSCLFWRDLIATGDLPSLVMQLLARALNVPDAITL